MSVEIENLSKYIRIFMYIVIYMSIYFVSSMKLKELHGENVVLNRVFRLVNIRMNWLQFIISQSNSNHGSGDKNLKLFFTDVPTR